MTEMLTRRAAFGSSTFDKAAGTIRATLSSGVDVPRRDSRGTYMERLNLAGIVVRGGSDRAPVIDNHNRSSVDAVLGWGDEIQSGLRPGGNGALLHITRAAVLEQIEAGSLTGVSIGYAPGKDTWSEEAGKRIRTIDAATLYEISLTAFPADMGAALMRNTTMEDEVIDRTEVNTQIRNLSLAAAMTPEFTNGLIDRSVTVDGAKVAIYDEMTKRGVYIPARQIGPSGDDPTVIVERMAAAYANRLGAPGAIPEASLPYRQLGLHDMLRGLLSARRELRTCRSPSC